MRRLSKIVHGHRPVLGASRPPISDKANLLTRFSLNQVTGPLTNPDQTAIDPSFGVRFFDHQRNARVKYSRTISPRLIFETSWDMFAARRFSPAATMCSRESVSRTDYFEPFNTPAGSIFGSTETSTSSNRT